MDAFQVWKRLLWKEYREGRLVILLAAAAPFVLFPLSTTFPVSSIERGMLIMPGAVGVHLAIAFWGAGRGGSKRTGSEFAWTHLPTNPAVEWLASMVVPTIVIAAMGAWYGLAAAIVFRLMCPAPYLPFLPFSQIAAGFVGIGLAMTMPYLFGAACSVVLPGVVGSLLTMLVIAVLTGLDVALTLMLFGYGPDWVVVSALSWTGGAIVAALVIVRFGFTLSVAQRIRRYAFVMLGCVVCLTAAVLAAHRPTSWILTDYAYSFSPDLSNAIVLTQVRTYSIPRHMAQTQLIGFQSHSYFWRTTDGAKRDWPSGADLTSPSEWLNNDTYFDIRTCIWEHRRWVRPTLLTTVRLGKSGKLEITRIPMGYDVYVGSSHFISPDGKIAAFIAPRNPHTPGDERRYRFFDIEQRKWLETTVPCASYRRGWWQNDREYAWLDNKDNLHTTQVR